MVIVKKVPDLTTSSGRACEHWGLLSRIRLSQWALDSINLHLCMEKVFREELVSLPQSGIRTLESSVTLQNV